MKRKDCFFGLHFDFHAKRGTKGIGAHTSAEKLGELLDAVKPDFIQVDTKGHPGYASFMSEYGTVAPGLEVDHLKIIREETKKRGILLFAHYSGMFDEKAGQDHPEWSRVWPNGDKQVPHMSYYSSYADELMIPQLKELAGKYGFDGVWVDGEIAFMAPDFRQEVMQKLHDRGFDSIGEDYASPSRVAFGEITREDFDNFIKHYVTEVHKEYPDFEFASSYACSDWYPVKNDDLDYLSADIVDTKIFDVLVREFAGLGKPWDLMGYGMSENWGDSEIFFHPVNMKHISRICRVAAMIISQGGTYQIVHGMTPQGEIRFTELESMKEFAAFVRARQKFLQHSHPVKSAAVWVSNEDQIRSSRNLPGDRFTKVLPSVLPAIDSGRPVDVIYDHVVLSDKLDEYPAVIIPENKYILPEYHDALVGYMERGGSVIAVGPDACKAFTEVTSDEDRIMYFDDNGRYMNGVIKKRMVTFPDDMEPLADCYLNLMKRDMPKINAAAWKKVGKGALYCVGWNLFEQYGANLNFQSRDLIRSILDKADPKPAACLEDGIQCVEIVPCEKDGVKMVNVINRTDYEADRSPINCGAFSPAVDLTIAMKLDKTPEKLWFEPDHKELEFTYDGEYAHVKVPRVDIHGIIVAD